MYARSASSLEMVIARAGHVEEGVHAPFRAGARHVGPEAREGGNARARPASTTVVTPLAIPTTSGSMENARDAVVDVRVDVDQARRDDHSRARAPPGDPSLSAMRSATRATPPAGDADVAGRVDPLGGVDQPATRPRPASHRVELAFLPRPHRERKRHRDSRARGAGHEPAARGPGTGWRWRWRVDHCRASLLSRRDTTAVYAKRLPKARRLPAAAGSTRPVRRSISRRSGECCRCARAPSWERRSRGAPGC